MAQRIAIPAGLLPDDCEASLALTNAALPFPQSEVNRLSRRRYILDQLPKNSVGAEIGVFRGHFAELICKHVQPRTLYLIDPWTLLGETFGWGKGVYLNGGELTTELARQETTLRCARHPSTECCIIEGFYPDCADMIDEPLDWAYLDASHAFEDTYREVRALATQVKPGGLILGDDWRPDPTSFQHGVYRAVQKFTSESDWEIMICGPAGQWMIRRKPSYE
ncbi:Methyltransferase domain-containing protein [Aliiroseovarius halocynthiae]|uniref:Class I SAM-dependent methyltransferase n=1 Tax=Aliiroseovarius halocynthiae TaxID=985055 RepID=A0A545SV92_9RHOB|nr:class I SAM-dependent methyltransferase [Aliiroseovarius halocynthiae]TQV68890.1 class I SAM-dependent methyltransferase [Aliiroseovarius halocynthiae]SMR71421.1 Methyltransferase domain-containing protein [Aliiroseovarius halocynthiae]